MRKCDQFPQTAFGGSNATQGSHGTGQQTSKGGKGKGVRNPFPTTANGYSKSKGKG